MALMDEGNGMVMPVGPVNGNNGFGGFGGDLAWIIILCLIFGWGNGNGNGFNRGGNSASGDLLYPWMNQSQAVNSGFANLQTAMTSAFGDVQSSLCNGFAGVNANITSAQMALMPQLFGIQSAQQQCCCENRAAIADLKYTVATEACADRAAVKDGVQAILDKLCASELEAERRENANLRSQLNMANLAASQTAQTSRILADNAAQTVALEQYLNPVAVPAYVVNNPRCCPQNFGCSCGA